MAFTNEETDVNMLFVYLPCHQGRNTGVKSFANLYTYCHIIIQKLNSEIVPNTTLIIVLNPYATGLNFTCHLIILTLRLLISYIHGAPSKARNANVVYIWTYVWQR